MKQNHSFVINLLILIFNFFIGIGGDVFNIVSFLEDTIFTLDTNNHDTKSLKDGWDDLHKCDADRRKELCLQALQTVFEDVIKTVELESYFVPKAQTYKELKADKYSQKSDENILHTNVISCPYSVPLYVYKKKDHNKILTFVAKFPFKFRDYVFDFEFVESILAEDEPFYFTEQEIHNHIFHKLEFGERWELCYEARRYVQEEITIDFAYIDRPEVYEFRYPFGPEEHIAINCSTEPGMWLRLKENKTIMIVRKLDSH